MISDRSKHQTSPNLSRVQTMVGRNHQHQLLSQIDRVFDVLALNTGNGEERPKKRRRLDQTAEEPQGGFVLDDEPAGGFILEHVPAKGDVSADDEKETDTILLSMIPDALQLLDLPPDDPEVLSVFRNAASGWSNQIPGDLGEGDVTRADFRSVCLVLLGGDEDMDIEETEPPSNVPQENNVDEESDGALSDAYEESSLTSPEEEEGEDDDYQDSDYGDARPKSKGKRTKTQKDSESDLDLSARPITSRQRQVCLDAFQLFFPSANSNDLPQQRIGLKDLMRAAESIKERIKAEDMQEMLKEFSSSPDKSMNLEDFQKMMLAAKLA